MKITKCDKHNTLIIILESNEEGLFSSKLDATVIFFDSRKKPYLKRSVRGQCDENCPAVSKVLAGLETPLPPVDISAVSLSGNPNLF